MIILSLFRDRSEETIKRYIKQVESIPGKVDVVCVENDSANSTRILLERWVKRVNRRKSGKLKIHVVGETTGEKFYPSMVDKERFRILSQAANIGLDYIENEIKPEEDRAFMFVESDLIWDNKVVDDLVKNIDKGLVAPMVWTEKDKIFYDFWAYRALPEKGGDYFPTKNQEWYRANWGVGLVEAQSVGSMFVIDWGNVKDARLGEEAVVTFTREVNCKVYVDQDVNVYHPQ